MAQTPSAPSPASDLQSTRQMLDELDALMERMLALPVDDDASEPEPPAPALGPTPTVAASLTLLTPDEAPPEPHVYRTRVTMSEPEPEIENDANSGGSYFDLPDSPLADEEALAELEASLPTLEQATLTWLEERESATREPGRRSTTATRAETMLPTLPEMDVTATADPVIMPATGRSRGFFLWLTLRALNGLFDLVTHLLGPAGEWLRGPRGRDLLGVAGILMLLGAAAWLAAQWMHWL